MHHRNCDFGFHCDEVNGRGDFLLTVEGSSVQGEDYQTVASVDIPHTKPCTLNSVLTSPELCMPPCRPSGLESPPAGSAAASGEVLAARPPQHAREVIRKFTHPCGRPRETSASEPAWEL